MLSNFKMYGFKKGEYVRVKILKKDLIGWNCKRYYEKINNQIGIVKSYQKNTRFNIVIEILKLRGTLNQFMGVMPKYLKKLTQEEIIAETL